MTYLGGGAEDLHVRSFYPKRGGPLDPSFLLSTLSPAIQMGDVLKNVHVFSRTRAPEDRASLRYVPSRRPLAFSRLTALASQDRSTHLLHEIIFVVHVESVSSGPIKT